MMGTVDGRILTERWDLPPAAEKQYEAVHALHQADAWMCGRRTFQGDFMDQPRDATFPRGAKVPPGDFIAPSAAPSGRRGRQPVCAIAIDPQGRIRWDSAEMRGDRLVVITTGRASPGYLADLRAKEISYLLGGKSRIDFGSVLERLGRIFGLRKLMLEGGGSINGALLAAGLVDEISLLVCPVVDGAAGAPTVFDLPKGREGAKASALRLFAMKARPGGVVWLRYKVLGKR